MSEKNLSSRAQTIVGVSSFLSEALSWANLTCYATALLEQPDRSVVVVAYIPRRAPLVTSVQIIANSFCEDVALTSLEPEGREYKAIFRLAPGALAVEH